MSRAKSILFLTLLPSVIVLVLFAYTYAKKWTQKDEIVATATDGTQIHGIRAMSGAVSGSSQSLAVFLPDPAFDRSLNSRSIETNAGAELEALVLKRGIHLLRYESRGTGRTPGVSRFVPPGILADDLMKAGAGATTVIAHGDSCATAALAWKKGMQAKRWIFVSCAYSGNPVDEWAARTFYSMENSLMSEKLIQTCRKEWSTFRKDLRQTVSSKSGPPPVVPAKEGESPDLMVFRGAMREMAYEQKAWTREALDFDVMRTIVQMNRKEDLVWFVPEFDTVTVPSEVEAMKKAGVTPRPLFQTDYFLLQTDSPRRTSMERIFFLKSPFTHPSSSALLAIADAVK